MGQRAMKINDILPSLDECMEHVREGIEGKAISPEAVHCIGATWVYIESKLNQKGES